MRALVLLCGEDIFIRFCFLLVYGIEKVYLVPYGIKWCRALREVWPRSLERVNLIEPSQSMQRAGQSLIKGYL